MFGHPTCLRLADTVMMGTMITETTTTIDVTFLLVDMAVMMTTMIDATSGFQLADMVMMEMMMETRTTIDATFLLVDMVVVMMTEAGTVTETTMATTDANSRVLKSYSETIT